MPTVVKQKHSAQRAFLLLQIELELNAIPDIPQFARYTDSVKTLVARR